MSSFIYYTRMPPAETYTLSLHDALPISYRRKHHGPAPKPAAVHMDRCGYFTLSQTSMLTLILPSVWNGNGGVVSVIRSEEHTSELQSHSDLVCRLLLEKKKNWFTLWTSF